VVIGSTGSGYFDRWGLAAPGHVGVVVAILALLALSIIRNPVPSWLRTGVAGLAIGSLLLGLAWPYLLNPALEAAPGVLIEAIGSVALIAAGILALVTDRHGEPKQAV
jgi:predicted membrane-bound spermidine synthase